ncbi:hypothetical protein Hypma_008940 [Hypsizygus marmoreus]|uniref:F-box domain-containing protein n=1 Tax=Hypsizygus marmoreus TaxID=39966 RepID=A0A369JR73_HYPMA|nr:hypothetical protein Hypma_008940 [Hypsizygus marmoreus]
MPPNLRSKKVLTREELLAHQQAIRAGPVNTSGLPALPTELLLEIISYFPTIRVPATSARNVEVFPGIYLQRTKVLRTLSQTCKSLRGMFLPLSWERIEPCASDRVGNNRRSSTRAGIPRLWEKVLATDLVRQLEIVTIRNPSLASYVKVVNVILTTFSSDTVVPELARCLALLPNLHTFQILGTSTPGGAALSTFQAKTYPTVRTLVLPSSALAIAKSFPHITRLYSLSTPDRMIIPKVLLEWCTDLEEFHGFEKMEYWMRIDQWLPMIYHIVDKLTKIQVMILDVSNATLTVDVIKPLARLPALHRIELITHCNRLGHQSLKVSEITDAAKDVLRRPLSPDKDPVDRVFVLRFMDGVETMAIPPDTDGTPPNARARCPCEYCRDD